MHTRYTRFPAEWEPQDAILMAWPRPEAGWGAIYSEAVAAYARLVATILRHEPVLLLIPEDTNPAQIRAELARHGEHAHPLTVLPASYDDSWARDFGPITLQRAGAPELQDFVFNGWGGKFPAERDSAVTALLTRSGRFAAPVVPHRWVLEGGSIESDGAGTLLTTSECLLHTGRNPAHDRAQIESYLCESLAVDRVLWLDNGWLEGDDTDGHVDMLARFCDASTIAYVHCEDRSDPHFAPLDAMRCELEALRTANGTPYRLIPLPFPQACFNAAGERLPASYANFLIINGAVIAPVYGAPEDAAALATLAQAFPDRVIEPVPALPFIHQSGSVHCLTMQLPAGVLRHD